MAQVQLSEREVRIQKTQKLQTTHLIKDIIATYENQQLREIEAIIEAPEVQVKTAGRVMLYRSHGKLAFAKILDSTEQIQLMFHRDQCKIIKTEKKADGSMEDIAVESLDFPESET